MFISINIFQLLVNLICDATIPVQFKIENNFDTQFIKLDIYIYIKIHIKILSKIQFKMIRYTLIRYTLSLYLVMYSHAVL